MGEENRKQGPQSSSLPLILPPGSLHGLGPGACPYQRGFRDRMERS